MYSDIAKPTDISDTEWDRRSYNMFVLHMANAPRVIIDSTLAASNNGVGDVKLLSRLPAFNLTLNTGSLARRSATVQPYKRLESQCANSLAGEFGGEFPAG